MEPVSEPRAVDKQRSEGNCRERCRCRQTSDETRSRRFSVARADIQSKDEREERRRLSRQQRGGEENGCQPPGASTRGEERERTRRCKGEGKRFREIAGAGEHQP